MAPPQRWDARKSDDEINNPNDIPVESPGWGRADMSGYNASPPSQEPPVQPPPVQPAPQPQPVDDYAPRPTIYTPPSTSFYDDNSGGSNEMVEPVTASPAAEPAKEPVDVVGGPRPDDKAKLKEKENALFKKMGEIITPDNIEGMSKTLQAYGVELPTNELKNILPLFMPFLAKYGTRIMGGDDPEKFVKFSSGASKVAEFFNDLQPLLGAIIAAVMKPPTDAQGRVILRPEDEKRFDHLEKEVDSGSLSSFLKDGDGEQQQGGEDSSDTGLPADMKPSPKRLSFTGRGGARDAALYAADDKPEEKTGVFESIEELEAKHAKDFPTYASQMEEIRARDEKMHARPAAKEAGLLVKEPPVVVLTPTPPSPVAASKPPSAKKEVRPSDNVVGDNDDGRVLEEKESPVNKDPEDENLDPEEMDLYDLESDEDKS